MIRKFKHKITGNIATETNSEKNYKVSEPKNFTIPKWIIEDSGDWEEVKEFPKIVSFRAINVNKTVIKIATDGYFNNYSLDSMLHIDGCVDSGHFEIYQVAVSETEVFTLGDKVSVYGNSNKWVIKSFEISDKEPIKVKVVDVYNWELRADIGSIKKYKEPILVTDDNVEIFEGDEYFSVRLDTLEILKSNENWVSSLKLIKYFSTKKAAEQFISENKPIYSKKQVKEALECAVHEYIKYVNSTSWERTFKQKLNL